MLAVLPQVKTGFCSDPAASLLSVLPVRSTKPGPTLLAKTISAEQCKTEPEWVVAGKPPQALEQPTMCSCPPSQGGSREKSSSFFLLPHPCGSCHPFSREARRVGSLLSWLWGYKQEHHGNPQSVHDTATGTKLFQVQKQNPDPFMMAVEGPW